MTRTGSGSHLVLRLYTALFVAYMFLPLGVLRQRERRPEGRR